MKGLTVASVSWIDKKNLPPADTGYLIQAATDWSKRIALGLIGTANPPPPTDLSSLNDFLSIRQYRAALACELDDKRRLVPSSVVIDPGYTPPFDKSQWNSAVKFLMGFKIPDDPTFYPGESSSLSSVSSTLHSNSTLTVPFGWNVIVSALIKFRAGSHTNKLGESVGSPYHVPWVWCEYALIENKNTYRFLGAGSSFPSHAWYINGKRVGLQLQKSVQANPQEPAIATGQPSNQIQTNAKLDRSVGGVASQPYSVGAGDTFSLDVTNEIRWPQSK